MVTTTSLEHRVVAGVSFVAMALWPALGWRRRPIASLLRPLPMIAAAVAMGALCLWFFLVWDSDGTTVGFVERLADGAEAVFTGLVEWALLLRERSRRSRIRF